MHCTEDKLMRFSPSKLLAVGSLGSSWLSLTSDLSADWLEAEPREIR